MKLIDYSDNYMPATNCRKTTCSAALPYKVMLVIFKITQQSTTYCN
jgi:hypothetical protein